MRCYRCGAHVYRYQVCITCGYEDRVEWWEWVILLAVFGGLVLGGIYEVL